MITDRCKAPVCGHQLGLALIAMVPPAVPRLLIVTRSLTYSVNSLIPVGCQHGQESQLGCAG